MNLQGKTREQIQAALKGKRAADLIELICSLAILEPHFTDKEIAARRRIGYRKVRKLMRAGVIAPAHKQGRTTSWTAPLSAVLRYDEKTSVSVAARAD